MVENKDLYRNTIGVKEKALIEKTLERTFDNQIKAAKILGINRNTLRSKIRKFGISVNRWKL
jgi:DNA-binding protein Fis